MLNGEWLVHLKHKLEDKEVAKISGVVTIGKEDVSKIWKEST